jgi:hypothetical protein
LPTRKEGTRKAQVDFATSQSGKDPEASSSRWKLVVEYFHDGGLANYYLTNV